MQHILFAGLFFFFFFDAVKVLTVKYRMNLYATVKSVSAHDNIKWTPSSG